jgi:hypothetical protein
MVRLTTALVMNDAALLSGSGRRPKLARTGGLFTGILVGGSGGRSKRVLAEAE